MSSGASHFPQPKRVTSAAALLREGELVAFPTETVYGLGANALNPSAVARIFELKQRPSFDPLIVHVPSLEAARSLASEFPEEALLLANRFWPGPLTLVLPKASHIPDIVTSGLPCVGIRIPSHPLAMALLREVGLPLAAPSANPFGGLSPTTAAHVREAFGDGLCVLDGGPCAVGLESTVISLAEGRPVLLRPGGIPVEGIEALVGPLRRLPPDAVLRPPAPGMLERHYAPDTPLWLDEAPPSGLRIGWLGLGSPAHPEPFTAIESLSETGDLREAAHRIFAALRRLDAQGLDAILAESVPHQGLGLAINDRLRRASAGRKPLD